MAHRHDTVGADGLVGEWLSLEDVAQLELFKSSKHAFKVKLNTNFGSTAGQSEPGIKAAVRRHYQRGDVICKAGEYGSTAFLILEGTATAMLPTDAAPAPIVGRSRASLARLGDLFARRSQGRRRAIAAESCGEMTAYGFRHGDRPTAPLTLGPGDVFGIDACINFYPRELTVEANDRCVVLEMLRSLVDTVREAGEKGAQLDDEYRRTAIRNQLALTPWLRELGETPLTQLAEGARLLTADADDVRDGIIYREGDDADAVYLVRAGTIKIARQRPDGERVLAYLGRGAAFGFEPVLASRPPAPLRLVCTSHPALGAIDLVRPITVGRGASCDVHIPAGTVSKRHCRFEERDGDLFVTDLDSANFTLLNEERIREAIVTEGDRITIVDYVFELVRPATDDTVLGSVTRLASAAGLDNFELVRLDGRQLRHVAAADARLRETLLGVGRTSLEHAVPEPIAPDAGALRPLIDLGLHNAQNTLLIDLDRCTRCDECVRACADAHDGITRFTRDGPRFGKYLVTLACRSCTDPKCMIGCPVGSIRRTESLEIHIEPWCIGCQRCANQCPYGNINMVELPATGAAPSAPTLRATVCDLCAGYDQPNCVYACPHDAAIRVNPGSFLSASDLF